MVLRTGSTVQIQPDIGTRTLRILALEYEDSPAHGPGLLVMAPMVAYERTSVVFLFTRCQFHTSEVHIMIVQN